eukprot:6060976-Amphidinium_carterae.2
MKTSSKCWNGCLLRTRRIAIPNQRELVARDALPRALVIQHTIPCASRLPAAAAAFQDLVKYAQRLMAFPEQVMDEAAGLVVLCEIVAFRKQLWINWLAGARLLRSTCIWLLYERLLRVRFDVCVACHELKGTIAR